jgi:hypothetical protein
MMNTACSFMCCQKLQLQLVQKEAYNYLYWLSSRMKSRTRCEHGHEKG